MNAGDLAGRAREVAGDLAMLGRLTRDLPPLLRQPLTPDEARSQVRERLETREQRFLAMAESQIYQNPSSPYLRLLRHAGCTFGDLRALVATEGIDGALRRLADDGVYVTFDELKGNRVAVRGSARFAFRQTDFDNPRVGAHFFLYSGGSSGRASRVSYSLPYLQEWAASASVFLEAHHLRRPRFAYWWPAPVHWLIMCGMLGHPLTGWFYPVQPLPRIVRWATDYLRLVERLAGYRVTPPRFCDLATPNRLADWLAGQVRTDSAQILWTMPSAGARLAVAAGEAGLDLRGVTFMIGGEPVTPARHRQIAATGATVIPIYSSTELSGLGFGCGTPDAPDDVHVMLDRYALIQRPREALPGEPTVDALLFTSLSPAAPKIALNAELGDYARREERECGCLLGAVGMRTHLADIRSFEKVTGEGVTFARSGLEQILEEALPARFGGSAIDFQLAEEEAPGGATRLVLRVSPAVGAVKESLLREALLEEIARRETSDQTHVRLWQRAGTVEVRREAPQATRAGKVLPLQIGRRAETSSGSPSAG